MYAEGAPGTKPNVPWSTNIRAIVSLFSVKFAVIASRSWKRMPRRGTAHTSASAV